MQDHSHCARFPSADAMNLTSLPCSRLAVDTQQWSRLAFGTAPAPGVGVDPSISPGRGGHGPEKFSEKVFPLILPLCLLFKGEETRLGVSI